MPSSDKIISRARHAAREFKLLDQKKTDVIVRAVYLAVLANRGRLAKKAVEETQLGIWEHKVIKNIIASQLVYEHIKNQKNSRCNRQRFLFGNHQDGSTDWTDFGSNSGNQSSRFSLPSRQGIR